MLKTTIAALLIYLGLAGTAGAQATCATYPTTLTNGTPKRSASFMSALGSGPDAAATRTSPWEHCPAAAVFARPV